MGHYFWSNTIWYILLAITSLISIVMILYKANNRKFIIGFICSVLGSTYFIEVGLLTLTDAYSYFPKINSNPFLDSVLGNYFSQQSVAATAVLIVVYKLPIIWDLFFAGIYYIIEGLFLKLGIYQHQWYRSWYTFIGMPVIFWIVRKWYYCMVKLCKSYVFYISLFFAARGLYSISIFLLLYILSIQVININLHMEFYRAQAVLVVSYMVILTIIMIILHKWKQKRIWKYGIFIFLFGIQYILTKSGIITIKSGWFFLITLLDLFGCYFWVVVMDYLLRKGVNVKNEL